MVDGLRNLVQGCYADCTTVEEVAELYADLKMENQKQMEYMMQILTNDEE